MTTVIFRALDEWSLWMPEIFLFVFASNVSVVVDEIGCIDECIVVMQFSKGTRYDANVAFFGQITVRI